MCLLTIGILCYNEELFLEKTFESAIAAINKISGSFEIVIVDDGSTDNSSIIAHRLTSNFVPTRVISFPTNRGIGYAIEAILKVSEAKNVIFLPGDYSFLSDEIAKVIEHAGTADIVCGFRKGRLKNFQTLSSLIVRLNFRLYARHVNIDVHGLNVYDRQLFLRHLAPSSRYLSIFETLVGVASEYPSVKSVSIKINSQTINNSNSRNLSSVVHLVLLNLRLLKQRINRWD